jgi:hypothetical protein
MGKFAILGKHMGRRRIIDTSIRKQNRRIQTERKIHFHPEYKLSMFEKQAEIRTDQRAAGIFGSREWAAITRLSASRSQLVGQFVV